MRESLPEIKQNVLSSFTAGMASIAFCEIISEKYSQEQAVIFVDSIANEMRESIAARIKFLKGFDALPSGFPFGSPEELQEQEAAYLEEIEAFSKKMYDLFEEKYKEYETTKDTKTTC